MKAWIAIACVWLAALIGSPAWAQSGNKGNTGGKGQQNNAGNSNAATQTIRGELAGVSTVGETMVDYASGRGVVAELTYLTVLGSSRDAGSPSSDKDSKGDQANKGKDDSNWNRRQVYHIAVGPETVVRDKTSQTDTKGSAKEKSAAALDRLELGDRIEVEFTPPGAQAGSNNSDKQATSAIHRKHGRHRIVRGMAKTITIISGPSDSGDKNASGDHKTGNSSGGSSSSETKK